MSSIDLPALADQPLVLAASTGGHLTQLVEIARRINARDDSLWVTFDDAQSRSMLRGRNVFFVPYIYPRDARGVIRAARLLHARLAGADAQYAGVVSTGAALAISAVVVARRLGLPAVYVESVSRTSGPSLSGRLIHGVHLATTLTQHPTWAGGRWGLTDSVLGDFRSMDTGSRRDSPSMFISLGTIRPYRFDRLIDAVLSSGLPNSSTVWQTGATPRRDLPGTVKDWMPADAFVREARRGDLVITHAGVGTILQLLELGVRPVILPREAGHREHVDDHQCQIATYLADRDLAHVLRPGADVARQLVAATGHRVAPR